MRDHDESVVAIVSIEWRAREGDFREGNGIFQWTIRCRAGRWRGTAEGEHLETRLYNYEPYHVGASLVTNSLYCPPFRNWPRVHALYLPLPSSLPISRGRGPLLGLRIMFRR